MFGIGKEMSVALVMWLLAGNHQAANVQFPKLSHKPPSVEIQKPDTDYAISAEAALKKLRETQDIVLVDTRNKTEFEKFGIPGSVNIPVFTVKSRTFLKSKSLFFINEGYNQSQLRQACEEVNAAGFRASFVHGGLKAWKENGGLIEGDSFAIKELSRITPLSFFAEKDDKNRIIIDVSSSDNNYIRSLLPQSLHIPYQKDEKNFVSEFQRKLAKQKYKALSSVLILNEKGDFYEDIEEAVRKADVKNVFFLKGGIEAYQKFLDERKLIRPAKHRSVEARKCLQCP